VTGVAQPKGSTRAFTPKGWTRPIITSANPKSKPWQQLVAEQAQGVAHEGMFLGPVSLSMVFHLPRPKSCPKHRVHHVTKPDSDKLARNVCDSLKGVLYQDDASVVELHVRKVYAPIGSAPCVVVTLAEAASPAAVQMTADSMFDDQEDTHATR